MSPTRYAAFLFSTLCLAACGATEEGEGHTYPTAADSINLDAGIGHGNSELTWAMGQMNTQSPRMVEIPSSAAATRDLLVEVDRLVAAAGGPAQVPWASLTLVDCIPVITGYDGDLLRDSDADGIPDDYKIDYGSACVSEPEVDPILRVTISGYRRLQDNGHGFRSFRGTVRNLVLLVEYLDTGALHRTVLNGTEEGRFAAGGATYSYDVTIKEFTSAPGEPDREWFRHVDLDLVFTPGVGHSLTLNTPLPSGSVTLGGRMQHIEPEVVDRIWYDFVLNTPTALQWNPACNGGDFIAGTFLGRHNGGSEAGFQINWGGCGVQGRELFGYVDR